MKDVAELAEVSHQTVSRYFRFNGGLKPQTVARIDKAVDELNYRPNLIARSMRTNRTGRVAVLVPPLTFDPARTLRGATTTAHDAGYSVEVLSLEGDARARSERVLQLADSGQVEGILSFMPLDAPLREDVARSTIVTVAAEYDEEFRGIGDLADGTPVALLIERLAEMGHRRFFHVTGDMRFLSARSRKHTYLETIDRLGLESVGVFDGDWSGESGEAAIESISDAMRPTAVIAANDLVAAGIIRGASLRGWSVPGDLSVTGWDNDPMGQFLLPSLTTVDRDLDRLGSRAMTRLLQALRGEEAPPSDDPIFHIVWRDSTAPPRRIDTNSDRSLA